jgi:hypothetical protein
LDHTLAVEPNRAIRPKGKFTVVEGRDCKLRFFPYRDELLSIAYSQLAAIARTALMSGSVYPSADDLSLLLHGCRRRSRSPTELITSICFGARQPISIASSRATGPLLTATQRGHGASLADREPGDAYCGKQSWCPGEPRSDWHLLTSTLLPRLDLVEFGKRSFKFGIEEPHRIKNFAEGCRCSCPVSLSKGEDAIVSQISHDRRVGNSIVD